LFLEIRDRFIESRDGPDNKNHIKDCRKLSKEIQKLTNTSNDKDAKAEFASMCETQMEDWDTPYSRVGPPTVCYDYSAVLELEPDNCNGRVLFLHIKNQFKTNSKDPTAEECPGGLNRELMALTGTTDVDDAHDFLHEMCHITLQQASNEAGTEGWGNLESEGSIDLNEFFEGDGFLNDEVGNFQQKESEFIKRGGYERFNYIGEDSRENDHYPTSEESYNAGKAIGNFYTNALGKSFLSSPTANFQKGSCSSSNAAVCCWHRDRQYFDKNGNCNEKDCANQTPGDNTDLCWTEEDGVIFPYPGDETENDLHCHGFAWAQDDLAPGDTNARARWNNLFFVSLYDHLYQRGYADEITDDPNIAGDQALCGCVEDMNPVARADCTEAVGRVNYEASQLEEGGRFTLRYVPGTFSLKFQACEGFDYKEDFGPEDYAEYGDEELTSSNNDLSAFVFRQYLEGKIDEDHVKKVEETLIGYRDPSVNEGDEERDIACQAAFAERYPDLDWAEIEIVAEEEAL